MYVCKVDFEDGSAHRGSVSMPVSRNCSRSQGDDTDLCVCVCVCVCMYACVEELFSQ